MKAVQAFKLETKDLHLLIETAVWFLCRMRFCMRRRRSVVACVWRTSGRGTQTPATLRTAASPWTTGRRRRDRRTSWTWRVNAARWSAAASHPNRRPTWSVWSNATRKLWPCPSATEPMTSTWSRVSESSVWFLNPGLFYCHSDTIIVINQIYN